MTSQYLTKRELADLLRVSTKCIDKWCAQRKIPFIQLPGCRRFEVQKIEGFLRAREFGGVASPRNADVPREVHIGTGGVN